MALFVNSAQRREQVRGGSGLAEACWGEHLAGEHLTGSEKYREHLRQVCARGKKEG